MRVEDHSRWGEMLWWVSERDADGHQHLDESMYAAEHSSTGPDMFKYG
jgi:hypothetical protein